MLSTVRQLSRMLAQQTQVGARQAIFGKQGDCFKKSSSKIVIKILRIQFFLSGFAQTCTYIAFEFGDGDRVSWWSHSCPSFHGAIESGTQGVRPLRQNATYLHSASGSDPVSPTFNCTAFHFALDIRKTVLFLVPN